MDIEAHSLQLMQENDNCARTVVIAVAEALGVPAPPELVAAATFFCGGLSRGCICGALTGAVLVSGYLDTLRPHPLGKKLGPGLHDLFKKNFGVTCCRAIKAKRPLHLKLSRKPCQELTARFAVLVHELWAPVFRN